MCPREPDDRLSQRDRFIEAARQLGADEDKTAFKAKLAQIARQKPKGDVPKPPASSPPKENAHD